MENPIDQIRKILELKGINVKANYDEHDNGCPKIQDEKGACKEECHYFRDCQFGSAMAIDYLGYHIDPKSFPNGFEAHLLNSIEMFHAGIRVDPKEIKGI